MKEKIPRPNPLILKNTGLFSAFSDDEISKILDLAKQQSFEALTNIVIEGELSWGFYILTEGTIGISKINPSTSESYELGHIKAPAIFGEISLIDENPRSATVRALCTCTAFHVSKENFSAFVESSRELERKFYLHCAKTLGNMLREINDKYVINQHQLWQKALRKEKASE